MSSFANISFPQSLGHFTSLSNFSRPYTYFSKQGKQKWQPQANPQRFSSAQQILQKYVFEDVLRVGF